MLGSTRRAVAVAAAAAGRRMALRVPPPPPRGLPPHVYDAQKRKRTKTETVQSSFERLPHTKISQQVRPELLASIGLAPPDKQIMREEMDAAAMDDGEELASVSAEDSDDNADLSAGSARSRSQVIEEARQSLVALHGALPELNHVELPDALADALHNAAICGDTKLAQSVFDFYAAAGLQVTAQQLNSLLNVYASAGDVRGSQKVFRLIGKAFSQTDAFAESMLVKAFVRAGLVEEAFEMAKRSSHVNEVMMSTLIGGLVAVQQGHLASRIYDVLRQGKFVPNSTLLDKLLLCCEQSHNGVWALQLIKEAEQNGVPLDAAHFAGAIGAVAQMPKAMEAVKQLLESMKSHGIALNDRALGNLLEAYGRHNQYETAASTYLAELSPEADKPRVPSRWVATALMYACSTPSAISFQKIPIQSLSPTEQAFMVAQRPLTVVKHILGIVEQTPHLQTGPVLDGILQAFCRHGFEYAALSLYDRYKEFGVEYTSRTYKAMLALAADKRKYELLDRFVKEHQSRGLPLEAHFAHVLIRGLARCDHLEEAADFIAYCSARGVSLDPKHMNTFRLRCLHVGQQALWGEVRRMLGPKDAVASQAPPAGPPPSRSEAQRRHRRRAQ